MTEDDVSRETEIDEEQEDEGIPPLKFSLRGQDYLITFADPAMLTGAHVKALRTQYGSSENPGVATNNFMGLACQLLIESWDLAGESPQLPRYEKGGNHKWRDSLPAKVLMRIEHHIGPHLEFLTKPRNTEDDGSPGSPHRPERA